MPLWGPAHCDAPSSKHPAQHVQPGARLPFTALSVSLLSLAAVARRGAHRPRSPVFLGSARVAVAWADARRLEHQHPSHTTGSLAEIRNRSRAGESRTGQACGCTLTAHRLCTSLDVYSLHVLCSARAQRASRRGERVARDESEARAQAPTLRSPASARRSATGAGMENNFSTRVGIRTHA